MTPRTTIERVEETTPFRGWRVHNHSPDGDLMASPASDSVESVAHDALNASLMAEKELGQFEASGFSPDEFSHDRPDLSDFGSDDLDE